MNPHKTVWVEVRPIVVRIFRSKTSALNANVPIEYMHYGDAVQEIRHSLFVRSKGDCETCGSPITESTAQMHEQKHRGKGGEISLENSLLICATCHIRFHKARNPRWKRTGIKNAAE